MLALAWRWDAASKNVENGLAARLGSSLCSGIGGRAATARVDRIHAAHRPIHGYARSRSWQPTLLPSGRIVLFNGYFDNAERIAAELGAQPGDPALLYGLAVERWSDAAEQHIIGEYCAIIADPQKLRLRLSRSPLQAPPLYYFHDRTLAAAASVPRALFAAGVERRLNETAVAKAALLDYSDEEASCFEKVLQAPLGSIVEIERGAPRVLRKWYNLLDIPDQPDTPDEEVIARVGELLSEGVRACLKGFTKPGVALSGGLDSPQVAVRALAALPPGKKLPTFTFHPEAGFDGRVPKRFIADERARVEAFAAMHPRLEPHFSGNEGYEHDHRWNELFHLIGAPAQLSTMYVYHGMMKEAAKEGCDVLLLSWWGNITFSDRGDCGWVEYLLTGKWRQLWLALAKPEIHEGSLARRFLARSLAGVLPYRIWKLLRRLYEPRQIPLRELRHPLSREYMQSLGVEARTTAAGWTGDRYQPRNRRDTRAMGLVPEPFLPEVHQGFEQLYGVALRDPTGYRPLVEYCVGLPTKMFMRDGQLRWLAKQMAKGIMPEAQRNTDIHGWWDADWHLRIGRRRAHFLAELDRIEKDKRLGKMFDIPRLRAALEDWPEQTEVEPEKYFGPQFAVPMALLTSRFINFVEGRNE
jgi:asparagine synthase (glutamine-hydrolysing)